LHWEHHRGFEMTGRTRSWKGAAAARAGTEASPREARVSATSRTRCPGTGASFRVPVVPEGVVLTRVGPAIPEVPVVPERVAVGFGVVSMPYYIIPAGHFW